MSPGIGRSQGHRASRRGDGLVVHGAVLVDVAVLVGQGRQRGGARCVRCGVPRVACDRLVEQIQRAALGRLVVTVLVHGAAAKVGVERDDVYRSTRRRALGLGCRRGGDLRGHGRRDRVGDLLLHRENIVDRALEGVRPAREAAAAIHQVDRHPDVVARPAHAAMQQEGDAQLCGDLHRAFVALAKQVRRGLRHHLQALVARERGAQLFREAFRKIGLARIAAQVFEGHHRDAAIPAGRRGRAEPSPPPTNRPGPRHRHDGPGSGQQQPSAAGVRACGRRLCEGRRFAARERHHRTQHGLQRVVGEPTTADLHGYGLVLAEPQGRIASVERHRHELFLVAPLGCFVQHPVRFQRVRRPQDHDRVARMQRRLDRLRKRGAAFDLCVPPDLEPRLFQRICHHPRAFAIGAGIAEEDARATLYARLALPAGHAWSP